MKTLKKMFQNLHGLDYKIEKQIFKEFLNLGRILKLISVEINLEKNKIFSSPKMHSTERMEQCMTGIST